MTAGGGLLVVQFVVVNHLELLLFKSEQIHTKKSLQNQTSKSNVTETFSYWFMKLSF